MRDILASIVSVLIAGFFAWCGSQQGGPILMGLPVLLLIAIISFLLHWLILIPSYLAKTEKFYDITGTFAYLILLGIAGYSVNINEDLTLRTKIVIIFVIIWSLRLGVFLLVRVFQVGEDKRFSEAKKSFFKFMMFYSISALWVFLTTVNALTLILNNSDIMGDFYFIIGTIVWIVGFSFEVIADEQKRHFRKNITNQGNFISKGLWSISRHPNYFGEILIWIGVAIISLPTLYGWQFSTLISPIFVTILLTKVSGINLLEENSDNKWGSSLSYQDYKEKTPLLIPTFKKCKILK